MSIEHTFDWKGFKYSLGLFVVCLMVGVAGKYGIVYAQQTFLAAPASATLAVLATDSTSGAAKIASYSTATPRRAISSLTIQDVIPVEGKFIAVDLDRMELALYQDGIITGQYPVLTKGRPGSPYETPGGFYSVLSKSIDHYNKTAGVHLPYSMQFYGNYFIHGWPYYTDGTPVSSAYSGGCIRLSSQNAKKVYAFAEQATKMFVYDPGAAVKEQTPLALKPAPMPSVSAESYLVADIDTGDVLLERGADTQRPIASITKLMTALVANETIMFHRDVLLLTAELKPRDVDASRGSIGLPVEDLLYPLLMESNNVVASRLAEHYGTDAFVKWMNDAAHALNMGHTVFADSSGISANNISTTEDLFRLSVYLTNKKSFIWDITRKPEKVLEVSNGRSYAFRNYNHFSGRVDFVGGKVGYTESARETMASVFTIPNGTEDRRVAVIVLRSDDSKADTAALADWTSRSVVSSGIAGAACVACATTQGYRKLDLQNF